MYFPFIKTIALIYLMTNKSILNAAINPPHWLYIKKKYLTTKISLLYRKIWSIDFIIVLTCLQLFYALWLENHICYMFIYFLYM